MIRNLLKINYYNGGSRLFLNQIYFSTSSSTNKCPVNSKDDISWQNALPFDKIPGGSIIDFFKFIFSLRKGGKYEHFSLIELNEELRNLYGDISKAFVSNKLLTGKNNMIITLNPKDIEYVFRTEGKYPLRKNVDSITYHRNVIKKDFFKESAGVAVDIDEKWYETRSKVNPILLQPKIVQRYIPSIDEIAIEFITRIKNILDENQETPADFMNEITKYTLESICWITMEKRLGSIKGYIDKNSESQEFIEAVHEMFDLMYHLDFMPSLWRIFPTRKFKKMMLTCDKILNFTMKYVDEAIERIRTTSKKRNDDEEVGVLEKLYKIDRNVAVVMALDMLGAGVDTTAGAVGSTIYLLAKNREKQEILRKELIKIMSAKDTKLTRDSMKNLPYLRACIKESLRIHPVVTGHSRAVGQDIVLSGYKVPKGTDVAMGFAVLQNDEKYFKKSKEFIPERWLRANENSDLSTKKINPFTYLPFGFGPRACVGKRFAELEIEIIISRLIRNFKIEWHYPDIRFSKSLFNVPSGDFKLRVIDVDN